MTPKDTPEAVAARDWEEWNRDYDARNGMGGRPLILDSGPWILVSVAQELPQPFTLSELVVACWEKSRQLFGLPGYETKHPSERRVYAPLCGEKGLIKTGWLKRVGDKYAVTERKP